MKMKQPILPQINDEPCNTTGLFPVGYYNVLPPAALMAPLHHELSTVDKVFDSAVTDNRLRQDLRDLVKEFRENPSMLLAHAAAKYFRFLTMGSVEEIEAYTVADLAVTGRLAYEKFLKAPPQEGLIMAFALNLLQNEINPFLSHGQRLEFVQVSVRRVFDRAYKTIWILQGYGKRDAYGWIGVSGEEDQPHHPVNVPVPILKENKLQQFTLDVDVKKTPNTKLLGKPVITRYCLIGNKQVIDTNIDVDTQVAARRIPIEPKPLLSESSRILLFIHGHSSRLEEAMDLALHLVEQGFVVVSMDLPGFGYSKSFDYTAIGEMPDNPDVNVLSTTGPFPALEFIEQFIIDFVASLGAKIGHPIENQIAAIIGGSLGGNMGLRLSQRSNTQFPWLNTIASWSPAGTWGFSWGRARLVPGLSGTFFDVGKHEGVRITRDRANEKDDPINTRYNYFIQVFGKFQAFEPNQSGMWYRAGWEPCKQKHIAGARYDREETYSDLFRQWHWRVAHEQLLFMHFEPTEPNGHPRFRNIQSRVLLGAGSEDKGADLYVHTKELLSVHMINTEGTQMWFLNTGHSIQNERPKALSNEITTFIAPPRPIGNTKEVWTEWAALGGPTLRQDSITIGTNEKGTLEVLGINSANSKIVVLRQKTLNQAIFETWSEITKKIGSATFNGQLAASYLSDGRLRLYARRVNGWITQCEQESANGSWAATDMGDNLRQLIGGTLAGTSVGVRVGNGWALPDTGKPIRLHIVAATSSDGRIFLRGQTSINYPKGFWGNSKVIGNTRFSRTPVIARNHDGRMEMFNVDRLGNIMHIWENTADNWQPEWVSLKGGKFTSGVSVVRNRDGRLQVFGRGTDGRVWHIWQTIPNGSWSEWESINGQLAKDSTPVAMLNPWGEVQVFARGSDDAIWHRRQTTFGWTEWNSLGGIVRSDPFVASNTNGTLMVFALGTDNRLFVRMQSSEFQAPPPVKPQFPGELSGKITIPKVCCGTEILSNPNLVTTLITFQAWPEPSLLPNLIVTFSPLTSDIENFYLNYQLKNIPNIKPLPDFFIPVDFNYFIYDSGFFTSFIDQSKRDFRLEFIPH
jgi:pimeloyl-ACP methyl ester carboxylesterase